VIAAGLLALFAAVLCFVPLFDLLGYDFCFALGLAAAFAGADVGHGVVVSAERTRRGTTLTSTLTSTSTSTSTSTLTSTSVTWPSLIARAALVAPGLLVLPLAFSLGNALRVRNCNLDAGLTFFLLLPLSSALMGTAAGVGAGVLIRRPRLGRVVAWLMPLVSLAWSAQRLYVDPGVFAYDPFGGYFPGPIYDEALRPPETLWWFRATNLLWAATALFAVAFVCPATADGPPRWRIRASSTTSKRWRFLQGALVVALVAVSWHVWQQRGALGFHVQRRDLLRVLDGERASARLRLRYARASGISSQDLELLMEDLAFRYDQLRDTFGVVPPEAITVYLFPSPDSKKALVGAGSTLFARPWSHEIFVNDDRFPTRHLRHEMAHVFAAGFGDPWFGVSLKVTWHGPVPAVRLASGLVEGFAEAADASDPGGPATLHEEARAILADGRGAPLVKILGTGFSTLSGARAYTLAGSFCRYLFDTRGRERARELYRSAGDFEATYGASLSALEAEWKSFLDKIPLDDRERAHAREQFRRPGIFQKVCAREQAARLAEARNLMGADPGRALAILDQACADDPAEPTLALQRAEVLAVAGRDEDAGAALTQLLKSVEVTDPLKVRAASDLATLAVHRGELERARAALDQALALATDESDERNLKAKLRALQDDVALRTLGRVLWGDDDAHPSVDPVLAFHLLGEFSRLHPEEALGPYLVGRQLASRDAWAALPPLRRACEPPLLAHPLDATFSRECERLLVLSAYRAQQWDVATRAADSWREGAATQAERLRAQDFLARIAWRRAKE